MSISSPTPPDANAVAQALLDDIENVGRTRLGPRSCNTQVEVAQDGTALAYCAYRSSHELEQHAPGMNESGWTLASQHAPSIHLPRGGVDAVWRRLSEAERAALPHVEATRNARETATVGRRNARQGFAIMGVIAAIVIAVVLSGGSDNTDTSTRSPAAAAEQRQKARELEQATRDSTCIVNGFGNKLCGDDAAAYCDLQYDDLGADSRQACQGLVSQSVLDRQQAIDNAINASP